MKNLSNISLIFLMLVLSALLGCNGERTFNSAGMAEPGRADGFTPGMARRPLTSAPATMPAAHARPTSVAASKSNQLKISRIYPAPEFALIQMDKVMPKEVGLKKPFDYSIRVTNLTNTTLTNVMVAEELSGNFKYTSSEPTAKENATNLVWKIDSLGPRASEQILVSGMATDTKPLELSTTVVTHFVPAYSVVKVIEPLLELTQTAPNQVTTCDQIPVDFMITNSGTGSARNVKFTATLSEGLKTPNGKSELALDIGTLAEKRSRRFRAKLQAAKTGKYVSKAVVSATGLKDVSQKSTIIVGQPVLALTKTGTEKQYVGRPVVYEITVTNESDAPARDTVVKDIIPTGVTSLKTTAGAKLYHSRELVWQLGTLEPKTSKKVYISYVPTREGTVADKTSVTAYCVDRATASAETSVAGVSGVLLEVIDVEDPVKVGSTTMYEVKVTNQGSTPATGIYITCNLQDNIRYVSSHGKTAGSIEGNVLKFAPLANLAPKTEATWGVVVQAIKPADTHFKATMNTEQLSRQVEETETTHLYK